MQVIATAGMEREKYGVTILDRENRFRELMHIFEGINRVIYDYRNGIYKQEDLLFLKRYEVSEEALRIAVMIPKDSKERQEQILSNILDNLPGM